MFASVSASRRSAGAPATALAAADLMDSIRAAAAGAPLGSRAAARLAVAEYVDTCYFGFDSVGDKDVALEPGGAEFLALREALAKDFAWAAKAVAFLADAYPGFGVAELAETAPEYLAARNALVCYFVADGSHTVTFGGARFSGPDLSAL